MNDWSAAFTLLFSLCLVQAVITKMARLPAREICFMSIFWCPWLSNKNTSNPVLRKRLAYPNYKSGLRHVTYVIEALIIDSRLFYKDVDTLSACRKCICICGRYLFAYAFIF